MTLSKNWLIALTLTGGAALAARLAARRAPRVQTTAPPVGLKTMHQGETRDEPSIAQHPRS